jgi:hypothetical protein
MKQRLIFLCMIGLVFFLPACQLAGNQKLEITPNETITNSPSYMPTSSPTRPPTETPTSTFLPTSTPTITPTPISMPRLAVAYITYHDLYIVKPHHEIVQPEIDLDDLRYHPILNRVIISDDGEIIIYTSTDTGPESLHVINSNGGGENTLLSSDYIDRLEPYNDLTIYIHLWDFVWIPRTHRLLLSIGSFAHRTGGGSFYDLFSLNADTGAFKRLRNRFEGGYAAPSPDGKKMTTSAWSSISLNSIDGSFLHRDVISFPDNFSLFWTPKVIWMQDSSRFGTIIPSIASLYDTRINIAISIWSVEAGNGSASLMANVENVGHSVLSPTLDWLGYTRYKKEPSTDEIWVSTVDGSRTILMGTGPGDIISFSPDGYHFLFYSGILPRGYSPCTRDVAETNVLVGSLEGVIMSIPGKIDPTRIQWINNSQFVFIEGEQILLGDIGGNSMVIGTADSCIFNFDAKDLDFRAGVE